MTSSNDYLNSPDHFACLACHSKTPINDPVAAVIDRPQRHRFLRSQIEAHRGDRKRLQQRLSAGYVIEEAAKRYFQLMESTIKNLRGKFNADDFHFLLNTNCSPVWSLNVGISLLDQVLDNFGVEASTLADIHDKKLRSLIKKLSRLSATEELAVVEACELVWRGYQNPML